MTSKKDEAAPLPNVMGDSKGENLLLVSYNTFWWSRKKAVLALASLQPSESCRIAFFILVILLIAYNTRLSSPCPPLDSIWEGLEYGGKIIEQPTRGSQI